jgi:diguanylate cyclase (GGDEF)-like protein
MDITSISIPTPLALAIIALFGYIIGRAGRTKPGADVDQARRELKRAKSVAKELETIADSIRKNLAAHSGSIEHFKDRVCELGAQNKEAAWQDLCREAEEMLKPTLRLAAQIAHAYDEIRQQSNHLMSFTEVRTDPLTRVSNRRALDETLETMFSLLNRYDQQFSVAILDIDHFKRLNDQHGHLFGDATLQSVAKSIDSNVRETDVVARYGGEEFVVIMPHTGLEGAAVFADRLRHKIETQLNVTVSGGVAAALESDTPQSLLSRADVALYSAKAAGRNRVFKHCGADVELVLAEAGASNLGGAVAV